MDFMFNITTTTNPYEKPKEKQSDLSSKDKKNKFKKSSQANGSGFSFQFTKNNKVKAVVARKRLKLNPIEEKRIESRKKVPANFIKNNATEVKNYVMSSILESDTDDNQEQTNFKKNYVMRPKHDDDNEGETVLSEHKNSNIDISLNIINSNEVPSASKEKPRKLTRTERFNKKQEEKMSSRKVERVLTKDELSEGIKKFSKIPISSKKARKKNICNNIGTKLLGQRLVKPVIEKVFTGCSLETLNIHPHLVKDLSDLLNIKELTTVQQKVIPKALDGNDLLVRSQTGSGKTLAYALPVVQKLQEIKPKITRNSGIMALIIVPTRELAIQTYEFLIKLLKPFTWIVSGYLCGGEKRKSEKARLRKGINILVGTAGRLLDHILHTDSCKLDKLQFLILDEADRLLELGYEKGIAKIVYTIDEHKRNAKVADEFRPQHNVAEDKSENKLQTLLLSATLTSNIKKLAGLAMKNPLFIDNSDENSMNHVKPINEHEEALSQAVKEDKLILPQNLNLSYAVVHPKLRLVTLSGILAKEFSNRKTKVLVFMATTEMVNFHHDLLNEALTTRVLDEDEEPNESENDEEPLLVGVKFFKLQGSMTQLERGGMFKAFRDCSSGILLTTDVAGRGIDVPEVELVIQYSPPQSLSDFVHRVGRTARVGKKGRAILFLAEEEIEFIKALEDKHIRISQEILEKILKNLKDKDSEAHTVQEAASNLQHKFEDLIEDDKELREKACKAYASWVRNYAAFPKDFKPMFNIKKAHMGHYAKSFGLKDPPTKFVMKHSEPKRPLPVNRLTYTEREEEKEIPLAETRKRKHNLSTVVSGGNRLVQFSAHRAHAPIFNNNKNKSLNKENKFAALSKKSMMMSVSEFDSGIPSKKRKI